MKLVIVESIIGSILALPGDTFYAGYPSGNLFAVVLETNPVPPGQKKLLRGASKSLPRYRVLFFHILWSEIPYTGIHFGTLQRGSVEEALCQRSNTILQKSTFLQKNVFFLCFELCGVLNTNIRWGLDLEPFGGARIWTVLYVNSFAKMLEHIPLRGIRYSAFLGPLWRGVLVTAIREFTRCGVDRNSEYT